MINLLINFSTLKSGGGQNVALNFLYSIETKPLEGVTCIYLVAKDSETHRYIEEKGCHMYIVAPRNALKRVLFEFFFGWYFLKKNKIDIVYSYFGYAWFPRRWPQIAGSADSNLYYPEIDFWGRYSRLSRIKRALVDRYRLFGVKRSDAVVFENAALEDRARQIYKLNETRVIKPSIFVNYNQINFDLSLPGHPNAKRGLFLCGWHLNKNIMLIPSLAAEIRRRNREFIFILTAPPDNSNFHAEFADLVRKHNVEDMMFLTGPVQKDQLSSLYGQIDYVFLLSKLESFSNNIIEAWHFGKPLLISDEPWARAICQDAAMYANRDSVGDIVDRLCDLLDAMDVRKRILDCGKAMLRSYPSIQERIHQEMDYIQYVFKKRQELSGSKL